VTDYSYLTVETRAPGVDPRRVLRAFVAATVGETWPFGPRASDGFFGDDPDVGGDWWVAETRAAPAPADVLDWGFLWAGNVHLGLRWPLTNRRAEPQVEPPGERSYVDCLQAVVHSFDDVARAVHVVYGDTSMVGETTVHALDGGPRLSVVESFRWGLDHDRWRRQKGPVPFGGEEPASRPWPVWFDGPAAYVQGKYGLHGITPAEVHDRDHLLGSEPLFTARGADGL
jgi:hypothetical protein